MDIQFMEEVREFELARVLPKLPPGSKLLEIGAGMGWQAKTLSEKGFDVEAIEIEGDFYGSGSIWPATVHYDGHTIPFEDNSFDIVFSSNVLEHIPHLTEFQKEIHRVLKPGGIALHVLPSGSWVFWTLVSHYLFSIKWVLEKVLTRLGVVKTKKQESKVIQIDDRIRNMSKGQLIRKALFPNRHGEQGNPVTEIYYYSRFFWSPFFRKTGWRIEEYEPTTLYYSGYGIFGPRIPVARRLIMSRLMGSSCSIYVMRSDQP